MKRLSVDIETYSPVDLKKCGVHKYVSDPEFDILMIAYKYEGDKRRVVDLTKEPFPAHLRAALKDKLFQKKAYNASFERTCLEKYLGIPMLAEQWTCTMVKAARAGYPLGLGFAAKAMRLAIQKHESGTKHIAYFCKPCKPTKANGMRTRNLPEHAPEAWEEFLEYCGIDVDTEDEVDAAVDWIPVTEFEQRFWDLDQKINDRGVRIDTVFVENAIKMFMDNKTKLKEEAMQITGLANPNSRDQLRAWVLDNGEYLEDLKKATVLELLETVENGDIRRVFELRLEMNKTSVSKYSAMSRYVCPDGRGKGFFQFYGANRTGRFAGRGAQLQNLPQNHLKVDEKQGIDDLSLARSIVRSGDLDYLEFMYGNVPDTLSQLIRTAFIPADGCRFIVSDFSAIEARIIAWLANEKWRMDVFATHGKIYEASASKMFKVPLESISYKDANGETVRGQNYDLRKRGKVSELALGYEGSVGALVKMGAIKEGLTMPELKPMVELWRSESPAIVALWRAYNSAALAAIRNPGKVYKCSRNVKFFMKRGTLFIRLPSGRFLCYVSAKESVNKWGRPGITYWGMDQTTKKWTLQETYGGKLTENICQAIARDCLAVAMVRLDAAGYEIVVHVHDETVAEMPFGVGSMQEINEIMGTSIDWAPDLILKAESFETMYYKKD